MDPSATESAFSLIKSTDGTPVSGSFTWSSNTMSFHPAAALSEGTTYRATMGTGAGDVAGNNLVTDKVWSFATIINVSATPGAVTIEAGSLRSGSASNLASDNNSYFNVNSTTRKTYTSSWYGMFGGVSKSLSALTVTYSGKNSRSCSQSVSIWNYSTSSWTQLDSRSVGTSEVKVVRSPSGTLSNYVSGTASEGNLRVRVRCTANNKSFYASGDLMRIDYSRP